MNTIRKKKGDTVKDVFQLKYTSNVINIAGWSNFLLSITSLANPSNTSSLIEQQIGSILDIAKGIIGFKPTGLINIGNYFYDIQATNSDNEIITLTEGRYIVGQDRTK